jgi:hypothetical protein
MMVVLSTVANPGTIALSDVFGMNADLVIESLKAQGFAVIFYDVCSGAVGVGEVRQVIALDENSYEIELVGIDGVTDAGLRVPFGSTIQVKIGTGSGC